MKINVSSFNPNILDRLSKLNLHRLADSKNVWILLEAVLPNNITNDITYL